MKKKSNKIRFLSIIFKHNKKNSFIAFLIMIVMAILDLLIPQITRKILDYAIPLKKIDLLIQLVVLYIMISVINPLCNVVSEYICSKIKKKVGVTLKLGMLKHISKLEGNYYTNIKTGDILSTIESDVNLLEGFGIDLIFTVFIDIATALIALYFLIQMQWDLMLIVILIQFVIIITQMKFTKLISIKIREIREKHGEISNIVQEYISNIMNVVISKSIFYFFRNYIKKEKEQVKRSIFLDIIYASNTSIGTILTDLITIVIYGYGGFKIIKGNMSLGELIAFQQYTWRLIGPCVNIIKSNTQIHRSSASIDRIFRILDEPIVIKQNNRAKHTNFIREVDFQNVAFSYSSERVLDGITMSFKKGQVTALVGSSGCGKSTIVNLLYRLWDVDTGEIMIDNYDIKDCNLKYIRKKISIIEQNLLLFDDSIKNNMILGNKDIDMSAIIDVCEKVGIYEFINQLADGLDTIVGERGVKLSGGQKQRIAIARALFCQSQIIIMDEATSALDNISQKNILNNIKDYLKDKITIIIAHRLTTIQDADKIYVIENGRIKEEGSHEELILNESTYSKLLRSDCRITEI